MTSPKTTRRDLISGLYYKPMTIVNDDSRVFNKFEASLTDDTRVVIYNHHMFIVQATSGKVLGLGSCYPVNWTNV
jgi:hypothetical protein